MVRSRSNFQSFLESLSSSGKCAPAAECHFVTNSLRSHRQILAQTGVWFGLLAIKASPTAAWHHKSSRCRPSKDWPAGGYQTLPTPGARPEFSECHQAPVADSIARVD
jgi:hypothetical protein